MYPHDFSTPCLISNAEWIEIFDGMDSGSGMHPRGINLRQIEHPRYGLLTAVEAGRFWLVIAGEYIDAADDMMPPRFYPSTKLVNMAHEHEFGVEPYLEKRDRLASQGGGLWSSADSIRCSDCLLCGSAAGHDLW
ncbi:hypothetical protein [Brevundimonas pondensis]|uniref:Uncharacterized protein n=1 Tax=Brevundimonas pondensis TaxID=2774189 RepID=A0ABX7SMY5_9CAUL|nr:hypothetical protein [Brevundimonas pondensis]QTC88388.1 hypothetical protein IFE19_03050 [Brevundimonas pondensis]